MSLQAPMAHSRLPKLKCSVIASAFTRTLNVRDVWLSTIQFSDRPYLIYGEERLTYGESHEQVNAVASWLFAQGVKPGDRVAIAMRNYPEWMLIYWACVSTGIAVVGMNADHGRDGLCDNGL